MSKELQTSEASPSGEKTMSLPSDDLFDIDEFRCIALARKISGYSASKQFQPVRHSDKRRQFTLRIAVTAICHQFNWDLLNERLREHLFCEPQAEIEERLVDISARDLEQWFRDIPEPERLRAKERARILREVGKTLKEDFGGDATKILERSRFRLEGTGGFYDLMDRFHTFREDPLRKKTNVLTHDIVRTRIAKFADEESIAPAIDYHLIRIYLRTGRVFSKHKSIFENLASADPHPRPRLVQLLRTKVAQAVKLTAQFSGLRIPDVNYVEWQLGRRICTREEPKCLINARTSELDPDVLKLFKGACPFMEMCAGFKDAKWMQLQEPVFKKSFY